MAQGAVTAADITSSSWSLELDQTVGKGAGSGIGNIVQGLADIDQCITIILFTVPGEDPLRPTFGCNISSYIDKPLPIAQSALIGVVTNALALWEPRITVQRVVTQIPVVQPGQLSVTVTWVLNLGALGPNPQLFGVIGPQVTTIVFV